MENSVEKALKEVLANQVVLYQLLTEIIDKQKGVHRSAGIQHYAADLKKEASKLVQ